MSFALHGQKVPFANAAHGDASTKEGRPSQSSIDVDANVTVEPSKCHDQGALYSCASEVVALDALAVPALAATEQTSFPLGC